VKILRSDNGGEYSSNEFKSFLASNGIQHQFTVPYSPQQKGVSERINRTLV
jgi:transposase InsO family protein